MQHMLKMPKWLVHRTSLRTTPPSPRPHHAWRRTWGNHRIGHRRSVAISFHLDKALSSSAVNVSGKGPGDSPLSSSLFFPTGLSLVVDHNDWFLPFACSLLPGCHNGYDVHCPVQKGLCHGPPSLREEVGVSEREGARERERERIGDSYHVAQTSKRPEVCDPSATW